MSNDPDSDCRYTEETAPGWVDGECLYTPFYQFAWQLVGITAIVVWTTVLAAVTFFVCWKLRILRVDTDTEVRGIDIDAVFLGWRFCSTR